VEHNDVLDGFVDFVVVHDLCFAFSILASPNFEIIFFAERTEHHHIRQILDQGDCLSMNRESYVDPLQLAYIQHNHRPFIQTQAQQLLLPDFISH
jgi:hypothetical protein